MVLFATNQCALAAFIPLAAAIVHINTALIGSKAAFADCEAAAQCPKAAIIQAIAVLAGAIAAVVGVKATGICIIPGGIHTKALEASFTGYSFSLAARIKNKNLQPDNIFTT